MPLTPVEIVTNLKRNPLLMETGVKALQRVSGPNLKPTSMTVKLWGFKRVICE
jgi:hypothetical protein